jgi:hypothetical protein
MLKSNSLCFCIEPIFCYTYLNLTCNLWPELKASQTNLRKFFKWKPCTDIHFLSTKHTILLLLLEKNVHFRHTECFSKSRCHSQSCVTSGSLEKRYLKCIVCWKSYSQHLTTAELEGCFSTMRRMKTFSRSTMSEEHRSALGMLSAGKTCPSCQVPSRERWLSEAFVLHKDRRMDFTYRLQVWVFYYYKFTFYFHYYVL